MDKDMTLKTLMEFTSKEWETMRCAEVEGGIIIGTNGVPVLTVAHEFGTFGERRALAKQFLSAIKTAMELKRRAFHREQMIKNKHYDNR